jgi:hypothetical protein
MIPEVIDWDAVRCLSIDGVAIRFVEGEVQHEIVFPNEDALHEALRRWTIESGKATEFFRRHDFQSNDVSI